MDWDTTALLSKVRMRTRVPSTRPGYTDPDTLQVATDELLSHVLPLMLAQQEDYLVSSTRINLVNGQATYRIPARAVGGKLQLCEVRAPDDAGWPLERKDARDISRLRPTTTLGMPQVVIIDGSLLRLYPVPGGIAGHVLSIRFYDRPGRLVLPPESVTPGCAKVVSVAGTTATITGETSLPTGAQTVDVVRGTPGFETLETSASASRAGTSLTVSSDLAAMLAAGDYICLPGTSPVPQIPPELHPLLALRVAAVQLQSKGDRETAQDLLSELRDLKEPLMRVLIRPRADLNQRRQNNGQRRWRIGGSWQQ